MNTMLHTAQTPLLAAHWGGPGAGGLGFLFFLIPLFWIGIFVLVATLVGRRWRRTGWESGASGPGGAGRSAESSLAERFAQGDIDEKEYRARLEVLRASHPAPPSRR